MHGCRPLGLETLKVPKFFWSCQLFGGAPWFNNRVGAHPGVIVSGLIRLSEVSVRTRLDKVLRALFNLFGVSPHVLKFYWPNQAFLVLHHLSHCFSLPVHPHTWLSKLSFFINIPERFRRLGEFGDALFHPVYRFNCITSSSPS
jgi:hypothetical protein